MLTLVKILLGFLIFLITIVSIILFYPVSYRFFLEKGEDIFVIKGRLFWLAGLVSCEYFYPEPGSLQIRLFGIRIFDYNKYMDKHNNKVSAPGTDTNEQSGSESVDSDDTFVPDPSVNQQNASINQETEGNAVKDRNNTDDDKYNGIFDKIKYKYKKLKYTIRNIYVKIKKALADATFLKELIERENTKGLFGHIKKRLCRLWKHSKPKNLEAYFTVGTGSPDTTGYLMALYGFVFPHLTKRQIVSLNADFENAVLIGTLKVKGHINVFTLLLNTISIGIDRRLWELVDLISKHK